MLKIYWNREGKYQEELKEIETTLPSLGKTNNKYLNLFSPDSDEFDII